MNAEHALALAGVWQSAALARALAQGQAVDEAAQQASLDSIFMIDAEDVPSVFGGSAGVRLGLQQLETHLRQPSANVELTRMALTMLQLERRLAARGSLRQRLLEGIERADRQRQHFHTLHDTVSHGLGELYSATISQLRPRIMVSGNPQLLTEAARVARIRANLLAGIRAAVLWHQIGGRRWQLLLQRRPLAQICRGLLSRLTLEHGQ